MQDPSYNRLAQLRLKYRERYDAVILVLYTLIVHVWALTIHPLGRDYALLAGHDAKFSPLAQWIFGGKIALFQDWVIGYRAVNLFVLYLCLLCIVYLVGVSVRGPFWIGTLAAVLFMANPATGEVILSLGGIGDLLPCLLALIALTLYAYHVQHPRHWTYVLALILFIVASAEAPGNAFLFLIILAYEWLIVPAETRQPRRLIPIVAVGLMLLIMHGPTLLARTMDPAQRFVPLFFLFYPLGFLPETLQGFQQAPWTGWAAAIVTLALIAFLVLKVQRKALLFGLLAAFLFRLPGGDRPVDFVHLVGGGQLITAGALYVLALVALFHRMMEHPKWRVLMVSGTTLLCVVFFAMQVHQAFGWRRTGHAVRYFQGSAQQAQSTPESPSIAVMPDYRNHNGAPLWLSESIAFNTPFNVAIPHVALTPLHYPGPGTIEVRIEAWSPEGGRIRITGVDALEVVAWLGGLVNPAQPFTSEAATWRVTEETADGFIIEVTALRPLPTTILSIEIP